MKRPMASFAGWTSPAILGLAAWLAFPATAAEGDVAGFLKSLNRSSHWRMVLTQSPAGSIHQATLAFASETNRSISKPSGVTMPNGVRLALSETGEAGKSPDEKTPDETRVNRAAKKRRVVTIEPMAPPKAFNAGSILQRHSSLLTPFENFEDLTAFSRTSGKMSEPVELAAFYFRRGEKEPASNMMASVANLVTNPVPDVLATAYAPRKPDFAKQSPFDALLGKKPETGRFIPPIGKEDHLWAASVLPAASFSARQQRCLASGIYFEARGESARGQAAVAQVILNRVRNPAYPDTICEVVYQNEDWTNRCQFSFACDNIKDRITSPHHWKMAGEVAMAVTAGKIWLPEVGSATHYHATYVKPDWARTMKKVGHIGLHVFYRTYGGGWI